MELLVSVRSAAEVEAALSGGADIIDAKEPSRGSLGAVSADVLTDILAQVPSQQTVSVALGDLASANEAHSVISSLRLPPRPARIFVKLGFAGVRSLGRVEAVVTAAVAASIRHPSSPLIVAVAYADAARAGTNSPDAVRRAAASAGAAGVLLDTYIKDGLGLLRWIDPTAMALWVTSARGAGLVTALAGGIHLQDLDLVCRADPDVLGVRGAACDGGREGSINAGRVYALCRCLVRVSSGSVQGAGLPTLRTGSRNA